MELNRAVSVLLWADIKSSSTDSYFMLKRKPYLFRTFPKQVIFINAIIQSFVFNITQND